MLRFECCKTRAGNRCKSLSLFPGILPLTSQGSVHRFPCICNGVRQTRHPFPFAFVNPCPCLCLCLLTLSLTLPLPLPCPAPSLLVPAPCPWSLPLPPLLQRPRRPKSVFCGSSGLKAELKHEQKKILTTGGTIKSCAALVNSTKDNHFTIIKQRYRMNFAKHNHFHIIK